MIEIDDKICKEEGCNKKATHLLMATGRFSSGVVGFYCKEHAELRYEDQDYREDPECP